MTLAAHKLFCMQKGAVFIFYKWVFLQWYNIKFQWCVYVLYMLCIKIITESCRAIIMPPTAELLFVAAVEEEEKKKEKIIIIIIE